MAHTASPLRPLAVRLAIGVGYTVFVSLSLAAASLVAIQLVALVPGAPSSEAIERMVTGGRGTASSLAVLVLAELGMLALAGGLALRTLGARACGLTRSGTGRAVRLLLPVLVLIVVLPTALSAAAGESLLADNLTWSSAALIVVAAFTIGLAEELAFRGALVAWLGGANAVWVSALGSAALFGASHLGVGQTANAVSVAAAIGIPFALVRLAGGSVWGLAVVHGLVDVVALLQLGSFELPTDTPTSDQAAQVALSLVVGGGYALWFARTRPDRMSEAPGTLRGTAPR